MGLLGEIGCCCEHPEDCQVLNAPEDKDQFYKTFSITNEKWDDEFCRVYFKSGGGTIEVIDERIEYPKDNVGISFIGTDISLGGLEFTANSYFSVQDIITFGNHTFTFTERWNWKKNKYDYFEQTIDYSICIDDNCNQDVFFGLNLFSSQNFYIIRNNEKAYFYLDDILLYCCKDKDNYHAEYTFKVSENLHVRGDKPEIPILISTFQWFKPAKWWLFPERIPHEYLTPEQGAKQLGDDFRESLYLGQLEKKKRACSYPLNCYYMEYGFKKYSEELSIQFHHLPSYIIKGLNFKGKYNASEQPVIEADIITEKRVDLSSLESDKHDIIEANGCTLTAQTLPPVSISNGDENLLVVEVIEGIGDDPDVSLVTLNEPIVGSIQGIQLQIAYDVIWAPNINITIGPNERLILYNVLKTEDTEGTLHPINQYFNSYRILEDAHYGTLTTSDTEFIYEPPECESLIIERIKYSFVSIFGYESIGYISIYVSNALSDWVRDREEDFWSLNPYYCNNLDTIIINKLDARIRGWTVPPLYHSLNETTALTNRDLSQGNSFECSINLDLYNAIHKRILSKEDLLQNNKYEYIEGISIPYDCSTPEAGTTAGATVIKNTIEWQPFPDNDYKSIYATVEPRTVKDNDDCTVNCYTHHVQNTLIPHSKKDIKQILVTITESIAAGTPTISDAYDINGYISGTLWDGNSNEIGELSTADHIIILSPREELLHNGTHCTPKIGAGPGTTEYSFGLGGAQTTQRIIDQCISALVQHEHSIDSYAYGDTLKNMLLADISAAGSYVQELVDKAILASVSNRLSSELSSSTVLSKMADKINRTSATLIDQIGSSSDYYIQLASVEDVSGDAYTYSSSCSVQEGDCDLYFRESANSPLIRIQPGSVLNRFYGGEKSWVTSDPDDPYHYYIHTSRWVTTLTVKSIEVEYIE